MTAEYTRQPLPTVQGIHLGPDLDDEFQGSVPGATGGTVNGGPLTGLQQDWSSGLYDCCQDEETCWWSFWCPALVFARTAQLFGLSTSPRECWLFSGALAVFFFGVMVLPFLWPVMLVGLLVFIFGRRGSVRTQIRGMLGVTAQGAEDCCVHFCCSFCALAQEAREAKAKHFPFIDFGTGEPLEVIEESSEALANAEEEKSFKEHLSTLSQLSKIILSISCGVFIFAIVVVMDVPSILVLLLVFAQPLVIMYLVYWKTHRRDAVLDIVVKLFAVGFWWTSIVSVIVEGIVQGILAMLLGVQALGGQVGGDSSSTSSMDPSATTGATLPDPVPGAVPVPMPGAASQEAIAEYYRAHMAKAMVGAFLMSFLVAAGVEETMKHFIVRCCQFHSAPRNQYTIIIYMVAGAMGFATFENIGYVFGVGSSMLPALTVFELELFTLGMRILMPIHAICAFIQGVNTAKRDLEARSFHLWHILLPAIALHGTFDFVMMAGDVYQVAYDVTSWAFSLGSVALGFLITYTAVLLVRRSYKRQQDRLLAGWHRLEPEADML